MSYDKKTRQEKAKVLREAAKRVLAEGLRLWKGEDNADMVQMIRGDARDMRKVAQLILTNKMKEACNHAGCMDTAARDRIPNSVWDWMHGREAY